MVNKRESPAEREIREMARRTLRRPVNNNTTPPPRSSSPLPIWLAKCTETATELRNSLGTPATVAFEFQKIESGLEDVLDGDSNPIGGTAHNVTNAPLEVDDLIMVTQELWTGKYIVVSVWTGRVKCDSADKNEYLEDQFERFELDSWEYFGDTVIAFDKVGHSGSNRMVAFLKPEHINGYNPANLQVLANGGTGSLGMHWINVVHCDGVS